MKRNLETAADALWAVRELLKARELSAAYDAIRAGDAVPEAVRQELQRIRRSIEALLPEGRFHYTEDAGVSEYVVQVKTPLTEAERDRLREIMTAAVHRVRQERPAAGIIG